LYKNSQKLSKTLKRYTGDLLAALLLAWMTRLPGQLDVAVQKAVAGLQVVMANTAASCPPELLHSKERTAEVGGQVHCNTKCMCI
jgi:hypothetical protein